MTRTTIGQRPFGVFLITPDDAKDILVRSADIRNRGINRHRVEEYAAMMRSGRWQTNTSGSLLYFNKDGMLVDGQHRMFALIDANVSLPFFIMQSDIRSDAMGAIFDNCQVRTIAQITDQPRAFCSVVEFLYRRIAEKNMRANASVVETFVKNLKDSNLFGQVYRMATTNCKKVGSAPLWSRSAFIAALLLKYNGIEDVFDAFIREDVTYEFGNTLWKDIRKTGNPSSMIAKKEAFFKFLYKLKNPTMGRIRLPEKFIEDVESKLREILV